MKTTGSYCGNSRTSLLSSCPLVTECVADLMVILAPYQGMHVRSSLFFPFYSTYNVPPPLSLSLPPLQYVYPPHPSISDICCRCCRCCSRCSSTTHRFFSRRRERIERRKCMDSYSCKLSRGQPREGGGDEVFSVSPMALNAPNNRS